MAKMHLSDLDLLLRRVSGDVEDRQIRNAQTASNINEIVESNKSYRVAPPPDVCEIKNAD